MTPIYQKKKNGSQIWQIMPASSKLRSLRLIRPREKQRNSSRSASAVQKKILYPGCGNHVIDALFPNAEITYVDPSDKDIRLIQDVIGPKARAVTLPIEDFDTAKQFDCLVSFNSHASMEEQLKRLQAGGYIFCGNYSAAPDAEAIIQIGTCTLCAVITEEQEDEQRVYRLHSNNLREYEEPSQIPDPSSTKPQRKQIADYYVFQKRG